MDEPSTTLNVHLDTLEYTRKGLRTRTPIDLTISHYNGVHLVRPKLAPVTLTAQHGFALDRAFPLPATLALLWSYRAADSPLPAFEIPAGPKGTLQVFGHADASGDEAHNKTLSERRAAAVVALLQSDVDTMLTLAADDGWTPWEYQVLLRVLGSNPGPTDGDPGPLTDLGLAHFARRYVSGFFHPNTQPRLAELDAHAFDAPTVEALLDAFVSAHAPNLEGCTLHTLRPCVGCSEFNPLSPGGGSQNRRVSLFAALDDPHPQNAPCTDGDPGACAVVGEGQYTCMWYREHVAAEPAQAPAFYDPRWLERPDGSYILSVLTNLPDDAPVVFDVFGHQEPVSTSTPWDDLTTRWSQPLNTTSVGGVATSSWKPAHELQLESDDGPMPVFRVATQGQEVHSWANPPDLVGIQLLDPEGRCFSNAQITLDTPSGALELTTNESGVAWIRDRTGGPFTVQLPADLLLPHPADTTVLKQARSVADLETKRGAKLETPAGRLTRLRVAPPVRAPGTISAHFDEGSVYPADTILALVRHSQDAVEAAPDARITLFAHSRPSGSPDTDKALTDRRARLVRAVLVSDLEELKTIVAEDAWAPTHYISLAHFLGYESDDPRQLWESFQSGYSAGHHHAPDRGLGTGTIDSTGTLDSATEHALLDAFLASVGSALSRDAFAETACAGCGSLNPPPEGEHPDRITLTVFPADSAPTAFPCVEGDASACHVAQQGEPCRFFIERCAETSLQYRWLDDAPREGEEVLYMGARVLVHEGHRVAAAVYGAPALVEDITYAYAPPPGSATPAPAPSQVAPRVHFTSPSDVLRVMFSKERRLRPEMTPDGTHLKPMAWRDTDTRTIEEVFLDFWIEAFGVVSQTACSPTRPTLQQLYQDLDGGAMVRVPADPSFDPIRGLSDEDFRVLALCSSMLAGGQTLNPYESGRYQPDPGAGRYSCNIYSTDLVDLLPHGAWIPKVQFKHPGRVQKKPTSAKTARLSAVGPSGVNRFLHATKGSGANDYGWIKLPCDPSVRSQRRGVRKTAQALANRGDLVVMSSAYNEKTRHVGHLATVMPDFAHLSKVDKESLTHTQGYEVYLDADGNEQKRHVIHVWDFDKADYPAEHHRAVRSQAGAYNGHGIRGGGLVMPTEYDKYKNPGFFRYDPSQDKSRGTDIERETK